MSNIADSYNVTFCQVCNPSNILDPAKSSQVEDLLGTISRELATDRKLRYIRQNVNLEVSSDALRYQTTYGSGGTFHMDSSARFMVSLGQRPTG